MAKPTYTLKINGQDHILTLGLGFLDKLDQLPRYQQDFNGLNIGLSLQKLFIHITQKNLNAAFDIIKYGTMTNTIRLTDSEIEDWLIEQGNDKQLNMELFTHFLALFPLLPGAGSIIKASQTEPGPIEKETSKESTEQP